MILSGSLFGIQHYEMIMTDPIETTTKYPAPTLPPHMTPIESQVWKFGILYFTSIGFSIFSAYLVIKWSREWNENYPEN